jgi:hypothetical protein
VRDQISITLTLLENEVDERGRERALIAERRAEAAAGGL